MILVFRIIDSLMGILSAQRRKRVARRGPLLEGLSVSSLDRQKDQSDHSKPDTTSGQPQHACGFIGNILLSCKGCHNLSAKLESALRCIDMKI